MALRNMPSSSEEEAHEAELVRAAVLASLRHDGRPSAVAKLNALRALLIFALVLLIGGAIFSALERGAEVEQREKLGDFLRRMHELLPDDAFLELVQFLGTDDRVAEELVKAALNHSTSADMPAPAAFAPHDWDFAGACFFCFTAATTIGYGNYTPVTAGGRLFLVFYAMVAIPACLNAFAQVSDGALRMLSQRFRRHQLFERRIIEAFNSFDVDRSGKLERREVRRAMRMLGYKLDDTEAGRTLAAKFDAGFDMSDPDADGALDVDEFRQFVLTVAPDAAAKVEMMLSKGYVVLLALGIFVVAVSLSTVIFSAFYEAEEWSSLDAFYFTIVTFTTIGFGDLSPDPHPGWFAAIFIATVFFGLGVTATLVRAASDPEFDTAATLRGLSPQLYDKLSRRSRRLAALVHAGICRGVACVLCRCPQRSVPHMSSMEVTRIDSQGQGGAKSPCSQNTALQVHSTVGSPGGAAGTASQLMLAQSTHESTMLSGTSSV